jgi:hypothetical protein
VNAQNSRLLRLSQNALLRLHQSFSACRDFEIVAFQIGLKLLYKFGGAAGFDPSIRL